MPSSPEDESIVREFMNISGAKADVARRHLSKCRYSLTRALDSFYADSNSIDNSPITAQPKRRKVAPKTAVNVKDIAQFFQQYVSSEAQEIQPEGISKLSTDLGIDPLDVAWLSIACECNAKTMGFFSPEEWERGMVAFGSASVADLRDCLPTIRETLKNDQSNFKRVYAFTFQFALEPGARNISLETATQLWELLLPFSGWDLADKWIEFIRTEEITTRNRAITRDVWTQLISLMSELPNAESLTRYDLDGGAWPTLFDDFHEYFSSN